jgi:hypothetical protein
VSYKVLGSPVAVSVSGLVSNPSCQEGCQDSKIRVKMLRYSGCQFL